jgi:hypothetical protein
LPDETTDMRLCRSIRNWRAAAVLLLGAALSSAAGARGVDPQLTAIAREARQAITVINWFYAEHHACPQPSRPAELAAMQSELGDGYSVEPQGQFVEIRGISMASGWLYYTSPDHPDRCTLWRKLGWDPGLIWRRHRDGEKWVYDPGDGSDERSIRFAP